jgi:hypothetical protein
LTPIGTITATPTEECAIKLQLGEQLAYGYLALKPADYSVSTGYAGKLSIRGFDLYPAIGKPKPREHVHIAGTWRKAEPAATANHSAGIASSGAAANKSPDAVSTSSDLVRMQTDIVMSGIRSMPSVSK